MLAFVMVSSSWVNRRPQRRADGTAPQATMLRFPEFRQPVPQEGAFQEGILASRFEVVPKMFSVILRMFHSSFWLHNRFLKTSMIQKSVMQVHDRRNCAHWSVLSQVLFATDTLFKKKVLKSSDQVLLRPSNAHRLTCILVDPRH